MSITAEKLCPPQIYGHVNRTGNEGVYGITAGQGKIVLLEKSGYFLSNEVTIEQKYENIQVVLFKGSN